MLVADQKSLSIAGLNSQKVESRRSFFKEDAEESVIVCVNRKKTYS